MRRALVEVLEASLGADAGRAVSVALLLEADERGDGRPLRTNNHKRLAGWYSAFASLPIQPCHVAMYIGMLTLMCVLGAWLGSEQPHCNH